MSLRQKTLNFGLPLPEDAFNSKTRAAAKTRSKKRCFYKPLPKEFQRDGFTYRQIACEGDAALYEQRSADAWSRAFRTK